MEKLLGIPRDQVRQQDDAYVLKLIDNEMERLGRIRFLKKLDQSVHNFEISWDVAQKLKQTELKAEMQSERRRAGIF